MTRRVVPILMLFLIVAGAAHAQFGGGGMGGGHRGGGRRSQQPPPESSAPASAPAPPERQIPTSRSQIIGVVKAIDRQSQRITIAYEPVEALNWPAGETPFGVEKSWLLDGVSVGEKVRFTIESQQISSIAPYAPASGEASR